MLFKKWKIISCLIIAVCSLLCSCKSDQKVAAINEPVNNKNVIVEVKDLYVDSEKTYIVAEVKLSEHDDVYEGVLSQLFIDVIGEAGYSYSCIGYDEIAKTQTYLICISSNKPLKGNIELSFHNYRSVSDPMRIIVDAEWNFSINSKQAQVLTNSLDINDSIISAIKVFGDAIIIIPSSADAIDELQACDIKLYEENGELIKQKYNSLSISNCYFSFGFIMSDTDLNECKLSKIVVKQNVYHFEK